MSTVVVEVVGVLEVATQEAWECLIVVVVVTQAAWECMVAQSLYMELLLEALLIRETIIIITMVIKVMPH